MKFKGNHFLRIQLLPAIIPELNEHEQEFPDFRLVDGPSTSQGRLQVFYKAKYRSVCTRGTNWTEADFEVACKSMGFGSGGFWKWFRRQNDTAPFVMSKPACNRSDTNLRNCANWTDDVIALAENLCQGEDDIGVFCWGPPTFLGHEYHWMGIDFQDAPWHYVTDISGISQIRESNSRLEHVDILYSGYDRYS
ncbi:unnamed protein product [Soboliphyme baturini]|uniref:SRCR domain-containing protein n=1 Tax=Soboliphyme baturini TaxID=241478 RepID=A0A183IY31_9BILA|nr:unnamed protein product [Soboliphyme baturini]